jgi:hypothetical protein
MDHMRAHRRWIVLGTLLAVAAVACYEGPFAHRNPNDPDARFTMRLEADRETISTASPVVQFTLVTEPATPGYTPLWQASIDTLIYHVENGRFSLTDVPEGPTTVQITASFLNRSAVRSLVIVP